jgi:hypothetical protein
MTKHHFRAFVGRGPMSLSDLESRINNWVDSNPEWTEHDVDHTLQPYYDDQMNLIGHWVSVRFTQDDTKSNLLQKLTDKLKDKVDWYRVYYDACNKDVADNCDWNDKAEWTAKDVTISSGIPSYEVSA